MIRLNTFEKAQQILALARSRDPSDRERLVLDLADLCEKGQGDGHKVDPAVRALTNSVFMALIADAERNIRKALADRLADAAWAPHDLVSLLVLDDIEIARPLIIQSPVLLDEDLVSLLALATIEHHIEVARRPSLSRTVVQAVLAQREPAVLTALADNDTADVSPEGMATLVEASRQIAGLRSPLARHPRMTPELAERLYIWVGQSLRAAIVGRFRVDAKALDAAIAGAVEAARATPSWSPIVKGGGDDDRRTMEVKLVRKLNETGQLRPGYLIRALRDQRLSLFTAALAELAGVDAKDVERSIFQNRPELLALACTAAGVDRSAYATILALVRQVAGGRPAGRSYAGQKAMYAFSVQDPEVAAEVFKQAVKAA